MTNWEGMLAILFEQSRRGHVIFDEEKDGPTVNALLVKGFIQHVSYGYDDGIGMDRTCWFTPTELGKRAMYVAGFRFMLEHVDEIDLDGKECDGGHYIGKATKKDGEWVCMANVNGALCVVAVKVELR